MDYSVGFSNATYLCQTLFSNVPISYYIAQIIVLHINLVSTEIRFIIDYKDVIIFLRRASLKEHYILWKYIKLLNYIYTHVYSSQHKTDWVYFNIMLQKANQLCATRVGKLLVSTSSSFYTYSHIFLRHHHIRQLLVVALKTIVSFSFFSNLRICKAIALERTYLYNEITWKTHTHA